MKSLFVGVACLFALVAAVPVEKTTGPALSPPPPPPAPPGFTEVERTVISGILEKHELKDVSKEMSMIEQRKYSKRDNDTDANSTEIGTQVEFNWKFPKQLIQLSPSNNMNVLFELFKQISELAQLIMDRSVDARKSPPPQPHYIQLGAHHQDPYVMNAQQMADDSIFPAMPLEGLYNEEQWRQGRGKIVQM
ncbi:unnamed protein product [Hymenolepis diminuta]|uniref:Uncharacterized protein n=1 Tax=Hymenolepis diminuta TaxID=6216 RepID=A0A0R3SXD3_HYMDI|nr:unnamed protein product [Hymenolepis diminuta]VUZ40409.1 unnamed protein product [Hymenolepis diminuta]